MCSLWGPSDPTSNGHLTQNQRHFKIFFAHVETSWRPWERAKKFFCWWGPPCCKWGAANGREPPHLQRSHLFVPESLPTPVLSLVTNLTQTWAITGGRPSLTTSLLITTPNSMLVSLSVSNLPASTYALLALLFAPFGVAWVTHESLERQKPPCLPVSLQWRRRVQNQISD